MNPQPKRAFCLVVVALAIATPVAIAHTGAEDDVQSIGTSFVVSVGGQPFVSAPVRLCYDIYGETCLVDKNVLVPTGARLLLRHVAPEYRPYTAVLDCRSGYTGKTLVATQQGRRHGGFQALLTTADGLVTLWQSEWVNLDSTIGNAEVTFSVCLDNEGNGLPGSGAEPGKIIVEKQTLPDGSSRSFSFSGDVSGAISDGQTIETAGLEPGTYTATEARRGGWDLTDISCDDSSSATLSSGDTATRTATFRLDPSETVKCTFTSAKRGKTSRRRK